MPESVTVEQVNAFLWHKQHLTPQNPSSDVLRTVQDVVALHATSALTPYLSLWARMVNFRPSHLDTELYVKRSLVKVLCMRQTLHVVPLSKLAILSAATRERLQQNARRELAQLMHWSGVTGAEEERVLDRLQNVIERVIATRGPSTATELGDAIPELKKQLHFAPDKPYGGLVSLGSMLVPRLTLLGLLVRGRPRGSWRSNQHEYALLRDWLSDGNLPVIPTHQAQADLVRSYLAAFGPAKLDDVAWWAGWSKGEAQRALLALASQLVQLHIEQLDGEFWLLASDMSTLVETEPLTSGAVRLLPSLDGYIMGYCDRRRFLDANHHDQVFDRSGNAFSSVWVDGRVVGIWHELAGGVECLIWDDEHAVSVEAEAESLGAFLRQGDTGEPDAMAHVQVRAYPPELHVKTPFSLGKR